MKIFFYYFKIEVFFYYFILNIIPICLKHYKFKYRTLEVPIFTGYYFIETYFRII